MWHSLNFPFTFSVHARRHSFKSSGSFHPVVETALNISFPLASFTRFPSSSRIYSLLCLLPQIPSSVKGRIGTSTWKWGLSGSSSFSAFPSWTARSTIMPRATNCSWQNSFASLIFSSSVNSFCSAMSNE